MNIEILSDTTTDNDIEKALNKYTPERRLLFYLEAESRLLDEGQENWNGDKKNMAGRLDYIQKQINRLRHEVSIKTRIKKGKGNCPFVTCKVKVV